MRADEDRIFSRHYGFRPKYRATGWGIFGSLSGRAQKVRSVRERAGTWAHIGRRLKQDRRSRIRF